MDQLSVSSIVLYEFIMAHYNDSELKTLCFRLAVNYEDLSGEGRMDKIRELVLYCQRHDLLIRLRNELMERQLDVSSLYILQSFSGEQKEEKVTVDVWVDILKGCATMTNPDRRSDVVRDLPEYIQGNIERRTTLYDDIYNITRTCMQYNRGMQALVAAIKRREGPSLCVQQLEAFL